MFRTALGLLSAALSSEAYSSAPGQPLVASVPHLPQAMHGCWELHEAPDEEFPDGLSEMLVIQPDRMISDASGVGRRVGTIEKVERLTPVLFEGLISAMENGRLVTLATALELDPEGSPRGTLLLREGDAGSYHFRRCGASAL